MNDMRAVIVPKSDQINADNLLGGPMTITITGVDIRPGTEQPVSIHFEGDGGKPYKPGKSMARVMVAAWGPDASAYTGRSMTLYCDPSVKWGGVEVGGIRISHMSHIDKQMVLALTATKGNKKPFVVKPLAIQPKKAATVSEWIAATLAPSLAACADMEALAKAQRSKGWQSAHDRGTDEDRAEMRRLLDAACARIEVAEPPDDDDDGFPGDA